MRLLWLSLMVFPLVCIAQVVPEQPALDVGTNALSSFSHVPRKGANTNSGFEYLAGGLTNREPEPSAPAPVQPVLAKRSANVVSEKPADHKRLWLMLIATQHGSAVLDAWSTRAALSNGRGYERDSLLKPFAGSSAIYPALQVMPLGLDYISRRMLNSSHPWLRKTWWVPQTASTVGFLWSSGRNLHVAQLK